MKFAEEERARAVTSFFTTYERIESIPLMVIKKDNTREPYDRDKIKSGISRSCHKRPVSTEVIDKMTDAVETEVFNYGSKRNLNKCNRRICYAAVKRC